MSLITKFTLPNGVRVLVEPSMTVKSVSIGLWCHTGSRHEFDNEAGITHLIEHMLFKGTKKRTAKEIAEAIEGRGGMLNAFTDKESTCYYCRMLSDDVAVGIDVLSDMMLNSLFEQEELEREEQVVLEEIRRGEDEPGDHVHEVHLEQRWGDHPLGKPIIGTAESVSSFMRDDLITYMDRRYRGENILLSVAGNVDPAAVVALAESTLGSIPSGTENGQPARPLSKPGMHYVERPVEQVHFCIGGDGLSFYDEDIYTLKVLDAALGGSMSSRLFQEIRERRGLAYAVGSYSLSYGAGGAFTVYGGTSRKNWEQVQELTAVEFGKVMKDGLMADELERTKRNLIGSIVLALESTSSKMMRQARNELNFQREIPIEETTATIEAVSSNQVIELARRLLDPATLSTTAIGPAS
jgi:predicted Zn-dependent peptidase